jgi:glutathione S-transferase
MAGKPEAFRMITVYGFSPSGNCHKVKLLLEQLGQDYRWVETDSARGATRTPEYLAKNPNGKVPMLELDDGRILVESNAILCWLAEGTQFLPADPWQRRRRWPGCSSSSTATSRTSRSRVSSAAGRRSTRRAARTCRSFANAAMPRWR